jgi:hypothetical protein
MNLRILLLLILTSHSLVCLDLSAKAASERPIEHRFAQDLDYNDLPQDVKGIVTLGVNADDLRKILIDRPNLVLDGATLKISEPDRGRVRTIAVNTLELRNGGKIEIGSIDLEIAAKTVISQDGQIISFLPRHEPEPVSSGQNGSPGLRSGTVSIFGELETQSLLHVSLAGGDGHAGGVGAQGPGGAAGPSGDNAADHLFDCAHGGGNGGIGAQGGKGGDGGRGGAGGPGGHLVLRGPIVEQRLQIDFAAPGGKGGEGGDGGPGGPGGPGGRGG